MIYGMRIAYRNVEFWMIVNLGVKQRTNIWVLVAYRRDGQKGKPPQNEFTLLQSPVLKRVNGKPTIYRICSH